MTNLFEINLEQKLLRENKKSVLTPNELLQLNRFNTFSELKSNDIMFRLGMENTLLKGKKISEDIAMFDTQIAKFDSNHVFHISQIEKICNKYMLKFLPIRYYDGVIDPDLFQKIINFELIYETRVSSGNSFIIAPKSSFKLANSRKDSLLFYKINNENYYLIHKWGKDLSIFNRVKSILYNSIRWLISIAILSILLIFNINITSLIVTGVFGAIWAIFLYVEYVDDDFNGIFPKFIYDCWYTL